MVWNETSGKVRLLAPDEGVVQMQLEGPLTNLGDLGVVDLDLIDSVRRNRSRKKRPQGCSVGLWSPLAAPPTGKPGYVAV
jgi:hypothetical protein